MPSKQQAAAPEAEASTLAEPVALAIGTLGEASLALATNLATRDERFAAIGAWSRIPEASVLGEALASLGLAMPEDGETILLGVEYLRDLAAEQAVGIDLSGLVTAVEDAMRPLRGMVDAAPLTGVAVPEQVSTMLANGASVIEQAGQVTKAKATKASTKASGEPKATSASKPWEAAGPLVRMVVTGPDGETVSKQKASNLASVSSSTKAKYGATLAQMAGRPIVAEYGEAFASGSDVTLATSSGTFTLRREG